MPAKGHKTITIRQEVYDKLWKIWQSKKEEYLKQGITSFSGFVTKYLYELLEREDQQDPQP